MALMLLLCASVLVVLVLQLAAAARGEDGTLTVRVDYSRVPFPPRVVPRTFRTLDEVRGGWKQQVLHSHAQALQQQQSSREQAEADVGQQFEQTEEELQQLRRQKEWEKQSGHSFGAGEISKGFDIESSEWWRVLEKAAATASSGGTDATGEGEEGNNNGLSRLVVVMLAPAWNADALALAREMEAMSARNATSVRVDGLSGTSEVSFVWVSDDQSVSEARQRMCSRRMPGKGDNSSSSSSSSSSSNNASGSGSIGDSKFVDEGIIKVILEKVIRGDAHQQQHEHIQTSIDTPTNGGDVAMEDFMHLPLPVIVVLERSGTRVLPHFSELGEKKSSEKISRFNCYLYNGSWNAWPIVQTAAKLSSEISRRDELPSWRDGLLMARPRDVRDMDELRLAYDFVAVAYVNCGACKKVYTRTRAEFPVSSDANKLKADMKACYRKCTAMRNAFRETSIFMCLSPTIRFAIVDLAFAAKLNSKNKNGGMADTEDGDGQTSAASDGAKATAAAEMKRLYYYKRPTFDDAGAAITGADDRFGADVAAAERDDFETFSLNLLSRHGKPFSFVLDDKVVSKDLAKELIPWLMSRMTHDMDVLDKDGVSVNTATAFGDMLNTSVRGAFDVERLGARSPALSHQPQRLKSKVNIIFFIDKFAPPTQVSDHDTASAVWNMRKLAFDFYNHRNDICSSHDSGAVPAPASMNRTQTACGKEADVYFSMMHSSSPPLKGSYAHWLGIRQLPAIGGVVYEYYDDMDEDGDADATNANARSEHVYSSHGIHFADGAAYIGDAKYYALQPAVEASLGPRHRGDIENENGEREDHNSDIGVLSSADIRHFVCSVVDGSANEHVHRTPESEDVRFTRDVRVLTASGFKKLVFGARPHDDMPAAGSDVPSILSTVTLVLLHAPYCGFCSRARALFSHLERKRDHGWLPRGVEIHFASVDCSVEDCRKMLAPAIIEEYPTVLLVTDDGTEPFVYEGSLHGSQLMRFVREVVIRLQR